MSVPVKSTNHKALGQNEEGLRKASIYLFLIAISSFMMSGVFYWGYVMVQRALQLVVYSPDYLILPIAMFAMIAATFFAVRTGLLVLACGVLFRILYWVARHRRRKHYREVIDCGTDPGPQPVCYGDITDQRKNTNPSCTQSE